MKGRITLLYDCFSCDVCDREHGIEYVTGEKKEHLLINQTYFLSNQ